MLSALFPPAALSVLGSGKLTLLPPLLSCSCFWCNYSFWGSFFLMVYPLYLNDILLPHTLHYNRIIFTFNASRLVMFWYLSLTLQWPHFFKSIDKVSSLLKEAAPHLSMLHMIGYLLQTWPLFCVKAPNKIVTSLIISWVCLSFEQKAATQIFLCPRPVALCCRLHF